MLDSFSDNKPYMPPLLPDTQAAGNLIKSKKATPEEAGKAAGEFEAVFISQMLAPMWAGVGADNYMGGGSAEDTYHSMLVNEYGKLMSKAGGLGIADAVKREMLKMQEKLS